MIYVFLFPNLSQKYCLKVKKCFAWYKITVSTRGAKRNLKTNGYCAHDNVPSWAKDAPFVANFTFKVNEKNPIGIPYQ